MSKAGGANRLPALAGCSFCHEQQKEPKNALDVTVAARTADGAALSRAATVPLNQFTAEETCLGRQSRFARMTQGPGFAGTRGVARIEPADSFRRASMK